jgi:hypothetical protein
MLFKIAQESKDEVVGFNEANKRPNQEETRKGSPLKSEKPDSSVIQGIQSTYPLVADFDFNKGKANRQE